MTGTGDRHQMESLIGFAGMRIRCKSAKHAPNFLDIPVFTLRTRTT